jgi:predicted RNA-binding Zn ribbon-like protein
VVTEIKQPPAIFVADSPGLDFLNSIATPVNSPVEWIKDGEGLLDWLQQAHLVPEAVLAEFRAGASPSELDHIAEQARQLREWFRAFVTAHKGRALKPKDLEQLEPLNRLLERDQAFSQIVPQPGDSRAPLVVARTRRWRSPDSLLLPLAEALAQLVCEESFADVKSCEGPVCTLLFADHTRARARRWCSMALCGNRAKQAAHRNRAKRPHR